MFGFRPVLNRVAARRFTVEVALRPGSAPAPGFDAADPRLAPDRQRMLSTFWRLRGYALDPDSCRNPHRVVAEFNALRNEFGYSPVDLHLKLQYFCRSGRHDHVLDCLRESRKAGVVCDLPTSNMVLDSLSKDACRHHVCRSILAQMLGQGSGADHNSFAYVLAAHLGAGDASQSITLLAQMFQRHMFPAADQYDQVVGLLCQQRRPEEVAWLLECAIHSPYPVGVGSAVRVVETFGAGAPTEFLARHLPRLRLQSAPDLLAALEAAFQTDSELLQLIADYREGRPGPDSADVVGRPPTLPAHLHDLHRRPASSAPWPRLDRRPGPGHARRSRRPTWT